MRWPPTNNCCGGVAPPTDRSGTAPGWHIAGCGAMGSLAAAYLQAAGWAPRVVRDHGPSRQTAALAFPDGRSAHLDLPVVAPADCAPIERLVLACKTPYTRAALRGLPLAADAVVVRLQNGMDELADVLGPDEALGLGPRVVEAVTTSAVKRVDAHSLQVVAENTTAFGGGHEPAFWPRLAAAWPGAEWQADIGPAQRAKLAVNAILNPLTALYDVANGALYDDADIGREAAALAAEADTILGAIDAAWPCDALARTQAVARATAGNTSSMRADLRAGAITEIAAINGWLVAQADRLGLPAPAHRAIVQRVTARHPTP